MTTVHSGSDHCSCSKRVTHAHLHCCTHGVMFYNYSIADLHIIWAISFCASFCVLCLCCGVQYVMCTFHLFGFFSSPWDLLSCVLKLTMHAPHSIALIMKFLNSPHNKGTNVQCITSMVPALSEHHSVCLPDIIECTCLKKSGVWM